jgi:hypothetical protein
LYRDDHVHRLAKSKKHKNSIKSKSHRAHKKLKKKINSYSINNSTMTQDLFVKPDFCSIDNDDDDFTSFVEVASKSTYKDVLDKLMKKNQ